MFQVAEQENIQEVKAIAVFRAVKLNLLEHPSDSCFACSQPLITLYGPQPSSGLRDGDVMLRSPYHPSNLNLAPLSLCFLPLFQRQELYLKYIAWQIDWKYLMVWSLKELRWLNLKSHKRFGLFNLWIVKGKKRKCWHLRGCTGGHRLRNRFLRPHEDIHY